MQLYSIERKVYQLIEGHTGAFTQYKLDENKNPSTLFAYVIRRTYEAKISRSEFIIRV